MYILIKSEKFLDCKEHVTQINLVICYFRILLASILICCRHELIT
jgi:hypothetical protein